MRIALISAIVGGFDTPKIVPEQSVAFDHYRFSDFDVPAEYRHLNPRTQALYFKQQMHHICPGYDIYIWVDGKVQITSATFIQQCIDSLGDGVIAMPPHPAGRTSVREEVDYITDQILKGDRYCSDRYGQRNLMTQLHEMGDWDDDQLNDCCIIICNPNTVFDEWWDKCQDEIAYDQIWIQYFFWINGTRIRNINFQPGSYKLVKHLK